MNTMKKITKLLLGLLIIPLITLNSCKKPKPDAPDVDPSLSFKTLKTYLVASNLDLPTILTTWITTADAVYATMTDADATNDYYVIDLRLAADYDAGHIPGAVNSTLITLINQASAAGGKPILLVCYTGQTASHAVVGLRLSGYPTAKVLKWGMAGWNSNYVGSWNSGTGDFGTSAWTAAPGHLTANSTHTEPAYTTTATDGAGILSERVNAMLAAGFKGVIGTEVAAATSNFFINNYWTAAEVEQYGHLNGAYRISPLTLAGNEYLNLDPNKKIVTYCYTGQTSSVITAYLTVLGYDAASLKYGANSLIYSQLALNKWAETESRNYPIVVSGTPTQTILTQYLVANDLDLPDMLLSWVTTSTVVNTIQTDADPNNNYYIIDIRTAADFAAGHIAGAVNSTLTNILTTAAGSNGKQIIVACYTGQTAAHAVIALRLSGYKNAMVMKWGMAGWNTSLAASWTAGIANIGKNHANWTAAPGLLTSNATFAVPTISSASTSGAGILAERVTYMLANGFKGETAANVLTNPGNYFINNYWTTTDVQAYGHISGAYRVNPLSIENNEIKNLNPAKTIITYCWTGQTSSMVTAYLNILGYNALSLKFGANGMINDDLLLNKWVISESKDFPLVTSK
jgi:rhodanese-related sulfurtransferase